MMIPDLHLSVFDKGLGVQIKRFKITAYFATDLLAFWYSLPVVDLYGIKMGFEDDIHMFESTHRHNYFLFTF